MKTRAAVAWEAGKPLEIEMIDLEGPKAGEVLLRNVATGVCHTDAFTLSGEDPEGIFPSVLGHEIPAPSHVHANEDAQERDGELDGEEDMGEDPTSGHRPISSEDGDGVQG